MKTEIYWLVCTVTMTGLFWVPYILNRFKEQGLWPTIANPNSDPIAKAAWATRMAAAHRNAVENLVVFAPLVLALSVSGISTPLTTLACMVYFYTRLAHYVIYTFGIPVLRTVAFLVGVGCQMLLAYTLLLVA
jgi:uncharacterized MAPEG superfamily protein